MRKYRTLPFKVVQSLAGKQAFCSFHAGPFKEQWVQVTGIARQNIGGWNYVPFLFGEKVSVSSLAKGIITSSKAEV